MNPDITLLFPPVIRFGSGCRADVPAALTRAAGGRQPRTFLVCSGTVARAGKLDAVLADEQVLLCGRFEAVPHDPPLTCVDAIIEQLRLTSAEAVLAVGGGSVIDSAKAAAIVAPEADHVRPFFEGSRSLSAPGLPLVALPTTAGTGAEITKNAVLSDHRHGVKKSLRSPFMVPAAAFVDPDLTFDLPPEVTAHSGLDALTQAIESYLSQAANAVTRPLAAEATKLLLEHLETAYTRGDDAAARTAVAQGSLLGAMAFSQSGLGAVHGLAHPLGQALGLSHGLVCAVLLPHILRWNAAVCQDDLTRLAEICGGADASGFIEEVTDLCRRLGIPPDFAGFGLDRVDPRYVLRNCRSGSMKCTPRPMSDADIEALLRRLAGS